MNTIVKAINKEKNKIRLFPVTFYEDKLAIVYEFEKDHDTFLPNLVSHILDQSPDARIVVSPDALFAPLETVQEVIGENLEMKLTEAKKI